MGHPQELLRALFDDRHPRDARLVAREAPLDLVEEPPVDLVDDVEVTRKQPREE
jgi:hypothetical protein